MAGWVGDACFAAMRGGGIHLYVADAETKRSEGLMFITKMPEDTGMLFVFEEEQQLSIRLRLATAVLDHITGEYGEEATSIDAFNRLKERYERMIQITSKKLEKTENNEVSPAFLPRYRQLLLELVQVQRKELTQMRHDNLFSEELLRGKEFELDLEEARFRRTGRALKVE